MRRMRSCDNEVELVSERRYFERSNRLKNMWRNKHGNVALSEWNERGGVDVDRRRYENADEKPRPW